MKLVYIANIRIPTEKAHGLQIMKTCEALVKQDVDLELVVPNRLNKIKEDPFSFYRVEKNFKIKKLWCIDFITHNFFGRLGFWLESWIFCQSVKKYLKINKFFVYYTRDLLTAYWLSKSFKPMFYEIHSLPERVRSIHKNTWERCKGLIVISEGIKKELIKYGVSEDKILLARDAVDLDQFKIKETKNECRKKLNLPKDKKIVVYTGHLYDWKGADLLAKAAGLLKEGIEVYLVGGTEIDVKKFEKKYKFPNLHIVGWQKHELIPFWLKAADLLVLPNSATTRIGSIYTSPVKLFEYMCVGKPIVASEVSALEEILDYVKYPVKYFRPDDLGSLVESINHVLGNIDKFISKKELTSEGIKEFGWESRAEKIKDFVY